jgi:hypothetical protein
MMLSGIGWVLCAISLFLSAGSMSLLSWAILSIIGFLPPLMYMALSGGPSITIAEVLYNSEEGR